jgi:hypothetical protein
MKQEFHNLNDLQLPYLLDLTINNVKQGQIQVAHPCIVNTYNRIIKNNRLLNTLEDAAYKCKLGEVCFFALETKIVEDLQSNRYTALYSYLSVSHAINLRQNFRQAYLVRILLLQSYSNLFMEPINLLFCEDDDPDMARMRAFSPIPKVSPESVINKMIRSDLEACPELVNDSDHFGKIKNDLDKGFVGMFYDPQIVIPKAVQEGQKFHEGFFKYLNQEML